MHFLEGLTIGIQAEKERHDREARAFVGGETPMWKAGQRLGGSERTHLRLSVLKAAPPPAPFVAKTPQTPGVSGLLILRRNAARFHMG